MMRYIIELESPFVLFCRKKSSSDRNNAQDTIIMNKTMDGGMGRSIRDKAGISISRISVYYHEDTIL